MKPFKTYHEQIEILKSRNLIIENNELVEEILAKENYYNVINGYKYLFLDNSSANEKYLNNCKFDEIYSLYSFDRQIRNIIFDPILQIENELRTQIAYVFSNAHQDGNYLCYNCFETLKAVGNEKTISERAEKIYSLISKIQNDISNSIKHKPYINHYIINYGYIPLWVLVNALPLNRLYTFYRLMNQSERVRVSKHWNIKEQELQQYIALLAYFRNLCAHDERIYCSKCNIKIQDTPFHNSLGIAKNSSNNYVYGKNDLFALLIVFKILLDQDDFNSVIDKISNKIGDLSNNLVTIKTDNVLSMMGFPMNWLELKNTSQLLLKENNLMLS